MSHSIIAYADGTLTVLDQTLLPGQARQIALRDLDTVVEAIRALRVRGAPLIGITAGYGVCVALREARDLAAARSAAPHVFQALRGSRPTAVNLFWALDRMEHALARVSGGAWFAELEAEARAIHEDTRRQDAAMAAQGEPLLAAGARVITHCNTGPLATGAGGTALGVLIAAHAALGGLHVFVDETRPRWQGASLTTWELAQSGVPHTLIADNAAAALMAAGGIHSVWVGADRIAANGDTANKIGTYGLAVAARHHGVPFYVVAPTSTIDLTLDTGAGIPIEERDGAEVSAPRGLAIAPAGTAVWNPAFDVTPAALIRAIVTERGVHAGPAFDLRRDLGA
jgi:methylthioribose-1-phosphate isomerase